MAETSSGKSYDLEERTYEFAKQGLSNHNIQIPNNKQIPIFNDRNFKRQTVRS